MAIKTLHITNSYHPSSGGIRTFYNELLSAANHHKRFVRLVVPGSETKTEEVGKFGRIYFIAAPPSPVLDSRYRILFPHTYASLWQTPLHKILVEEQPDLVEICDKFSLTYLPGVLRRQWITGVPVPVMVGLSCERLDHNVAAYVSTSNAAKSLSELYMRWSYAPRFDFHVAVSDYVAEELQAVLPGRMKDRLYVSPMGVDAEAFQNGHRDAHTLRCKLLQQLGANNSTSLLLYAGRLSKEKNLGVVPEILVRLLQNSRFDYRLIVAGEGPFAEDLRNSLERLAPNRSLFMVHQDKEKLAALYHAVDIFLHPNPHEPFGIAPIEAMAAGLPLVAPASGGLLTYANQENAWLTENSAASFAEAIHDCMANPALRLRKIAQARLTAARFSWSHVTQNYFRTYDHFHERLHHNRSGNVFEPVHFVPELAQQGAGLYV